MFIIFKNQDVEERSEKVLRLLSYAINTQFKAPKAPFNISKYLPRHTLGNFKRGLDYNLLSSATQVTLYVSGRNREREIQN